MVREYPWACCSGRVEAFLEVYVEQGLSRGKQRWPAPPTLSGYVTIGAAAELVDRSPATVYERIKQGQLESVKIEGRRLVSLASLQPHPVHTSGETAHVTVVYMDGGITGVVAGPYVINPTSERTVPRAEPFGAPASASEQVGGFVHGMFTDSGARRGMERHVTYKSGG
jgi:hypothetical protein